MPSLRVGSVRTCAGKKVVVLKTGLKEGDKDAVRVAQLRPVKQANGPGVDFNDTVWGRYRVLVGQVSTVRVADLRTVVLAPDIVKPDVMKVVLEQAAGLDE